jgi:hypothetical protein
MTVSDLLHKTDSRELTEWMVYYKLKNDDYENMKSGKKEESKESLGNQIKASMAGYKR